MIAEFVAQDPERRCCWRVSYKRIGRKKHGVFFLCFSQAIWGSCFVMLPLRRGISKMHDRDSILQLLDFACGICTPKKYNFVYMPVGRYSHAGLAIVNFVDAQACHQCFLALRQMQD